MKRAVNQLNAMFASRARDQGIRFNPRIKVQGGQLLHITAGDLECMHKFITSVLRLHKSTRSEQGPADNQIRLDRCTTTQQAPDAHAPRHFCCFERLNTGNLQTTYT